MPNLKPTLREMLSLARAEVGVPQRRTLSVNGGLVVEVNQQKNGEVFLALCQPNQTPTVTQWRDVLYAWPEPIPEIGPVAVTRKEGRVYRSVLHWPRPAVAGPGVHCDQMTR